MCNNLGLTIFFKAKLREFVGMIALFSVTSPLSRVSASSLLVADLRIPDSRPDALPTE